MQTANVGDVLPLLVGAVIGGLVGLLIAVAMPGERSHVTEPVQVPAVLTVAGFGPGVVYMAVRDSDGTVHVEHARVR